MNKSRFLEKTWNEFHLKQIKEKAKNRYTPKLNVDLPISEIFGGISRSKSFYVSIRTRFGSLGREFNRVSSKYENKEVQELYNNYSKVVTDLLEMLNGIKEYDTLKIPWNAVESRAKKAEDLSWQLTTKLREETDNAKKQKPTNNPKDARSASERFETDMHYLYQSQKEVRYFREFSKGVTAKLSNSPFLLLTGLAGSGKTHLLCDVVENRFKEANPLPSVLVFGEFFNGNTDLWKQIGAQLGLSRSYDKTNILNRLDKFGKKSDNRAILIIDALNESRPLRFWKRNLKKLVSDIRGYPNIALVVSVRSGFEDETLGKGARKVFVHEEHHGFRFREWEAVTKFFKEFSLPLPEIPLLMPEFQNPLFLLLFCKAFEKRKGTKKQIFRGHEGATYIFENYVDSVSKRIAKKFGIDNGPGKNIWDKVIENIAAEMVETNDDRVTEERVVEIVKNAYPSVKPSSFLNEIEKNLLLIKVPRYSPDYQRVTSFDCRFPFQKFSDHLIGRYIFKKYRSSNRSPKQFFSKNTKIGKFLLSGWKSGIVEALSIQCPEQLKGAEFFETASYMDQQLLVEAFVESLIWRRPDAFVKDLKTVLWFINHKVIMTKQGHSNLLNAFLSVASVPNHPLNAQFLHRHLAKTPRPKRDSWWSTFLNYQYGEKGSVDRLIEWGWSDYDVTHLKDESIKLCSVALAWFLTTSNRFVRDKATKALVKLLTYRLPIIAELVDQFKEVDDPYVIERLYAVAYGCSLRNKTDEQGLRKLGQWFYDNVFDQQRPPVNILIRDYARGVVTVAAERQLITIDRDKISPPYGSKWPKAIPSEDDLKKKYYPEDLFNKKSEERKYLDIWSSLMYDFGTLGDFGNYKVNSTLGYWSGRRLGSKEVSKKQQFEAFKKGLTKKQLTFFNRLDPFHGVKLEIILRSIVLQQKSDISETDLKNREKEEALIRQNNIEQFKKILSLEQREIYETELEPYMDGSNRINDPLERFNTKLAQRWIFNRVVQLGWSEKLHGEFDKNISRSRIDRSEHKVERIGKKYQWIAFHEMLGLVADNFEFKEDRWSEKPASTYKGPWQLSIRDIDPSCTLRDYPKEDSEDIPAFENHKFNYNAWTKKMTHKIWLKMTSDLPDPKRSIELVDKKKVEWVLIEGFVEWQEETPPEHEKYNIPTRRLWYIIKSYLVKKRDSAKVFDWTSKQDFSGRWMPESYEFYHVYLGEYPASQSFTLYSKGDGWTNKGRFREHRIPAKLLITDTEYVSSGSSIDCSTEASIHIKLPVKLMIDKMGLSQRYIDGRFFDKDGSLVAFDPTIFIKNIPNCLLFRKDKLCDFLKKEGYVLLWALLGEKNIIGGGGIGQPLGWLGISGAYRLNEEDKIFGKIRSDFKKSA